MASLKTKVNPLKRAVSAMAFKAFNDGAAIGSANDRSYPESSYEIITDDPYEMQIKVWETTSSRRYTGPRYFLIKVIEPTS